MSAHCPEPVAGGAAVRSPGQPRARGFTLIEVLLALTIFAVLATFAYRALDQLLRTQERVSSESRRWEDLARTVARLERDWAVLLPRDATNEAGQREPALYFVAGGNTLAFTRAGLAGSEGALNAPQRIGYRLNGSRYELLRWPHVDAAPRAEPAVAPLLTGVKSVEYRFLAASGQWSPEWPLRASIGEGPLPRAIEVALTLATGEVITRRIAMVLER